MPIYEYECLQCGTRLEKLIRNQADLPDTCPKCGARKLRKSFSAFSVATSASAAPGAACESCASGGSCPYSGDGSCGCE